MKAKEHNIQGLLAGPNTLSAYENFTPFVGTKQCQSSMPLKGHSFQKEVRRTVKPAPRNCLPQPKRSQSAGNRQEKEAFVIAPKKERSPCLDKTR